MNGSPSSFAVAPGAGLPPRSGAPPEAATADSDTSVLPAQPLRRRPSGVAEAPETRPAPPATASAAPPISDGTASPSIPPPAPARPVASPPGTAAAAAAAAAAAVVGHDQTAHHQPLPQEAPPVDVSGPGQPPHPRSGRQSVEPAAGAERTGPVARRRRSGTGTGTGGDLSGAAAGDAMDLAIDDPRHPPKRPRPRQRRRAPRDPGAATGRWTREEHEAFLRGLAAHGREWKRVAQLVATRTSAQVRSHAQKYLRKQELLLLAQHRRQAREGDRRHRLLRHDDDYYGAPYGDWSDRDDGDEEEDDDDDEEEDGEDGARSDRSPSRRRRGLGYPPYVPPSPGLQLQVDRILAQPHTVARQVQDTLAALHRRYRDLQERLHAAGGGVGVATEALLPRHNEHHHHHHQQRQPHLEHRHITLPFLPPPQTPVVAEPGVSEEQEWIALKVLHGKLAVPPPAPAATAAATPPPPPATAGRAPAPTGPSAAPLQHGDQSVTGNGSSGNSNDWYSLAALDARPVVPRRTEPPVPAHDNDDDQD